LKQEPPLSSECGLLYRASGWKAAGAAQKRPLTQASLAAGSAIKRQAPPWKKKEKEAGMNAEASDIRRNLETRLIEKAWKDPAFKKEVVSDPKGMFEKYLGKKLPPELKIVVHEEDAHTLHFSIPPAPANVGELNDDELERVAGGTELVVVSVMVSVSLGVTLPSAVVTKQQVGW
jgi:hypothetical protein